MTEPGAPGSAHGPATRDEPSWRELNEDIFAATILAAAGQLGVQPLAVEKDYWVCQALRAIEVHAPGQVIFKGGTSLEKLRIIQRFSEDLDLLVTGQYNSPRAVERALKGMCDAAEAAIPQSRQEKYRSGGTTGSMHRSVYLTIPVQADQAGGAVASPDAVLIELGQSGGREPSPRRPIESLLGRQLRAAAQPVDDFADLAPFEVYVLHPGRTLIEKLLRVNNFALDEARRDEHGWPRIGRQFYDLWALLGDVEVRDFLTNRARATEVLTSCIEVSRAFIQDLAPPKGGFAASPAFAPDWEHSAVLRSEHDKAMAGLYYGSTPPPTFDDVLARIREHAGLLDIAS